MITTKICAFCAIVKDTKKAHIIWEDESHIAFLSIHPNTPGLTVLATKQHFDSYIFDAPDTVLISLMIAAKKVAKLLDSKLDDVGRTALVFEGFGVNHLHAKLIPLHKTRMKKWKKMSRTLNIYFKKYDGYISTHHYKRANNGALSELVKKIVT